MITALKKLCNCPELIHPSSFGGSKGSKGGGGKGGGSKEGGGKEGGSKGGAGKGGGRGKGKGKGKEGKEGADDEDASTGAVSFDLIRDLYPAKFNPAVWQPENSGRLPLHNKNLLTNSLGKMLFLDRLLQHIRTTTNDRVVIISNYTQTLEVLSLMCTTRGYAFFRLVSNHLIAAHFISD